MKTLIQGGWVVGFDGKGHEVRIAPFKGKALFHNRQYVDVGQRFDAPSLYDGLKCEPN